MQNDTELEYKITTTNKQTNYRVIIPSVLHHAVRQTQLTLYSLSVDTVVAYKYKN